MNYAERQKQLDEIRLRDERDMLEDMGF